MLFRSLRREVVSPDRLVEDGAVGRLVHERPRDQLAGLGGQHILLHVGQERRARLGAGGGERLLVAHAGGGRDGAALLRLALEAAALLGGGLFGPRWRTLVVAGTALPAAEADALEAQAAGTPRVRFERHRPDLAACVAAADVALSMCGYATAAELLASGTPALLSPRRSDGEQVRRAERLARLGAARVLAGDAHPADVARAVRELAANPRPSLPPLDLGGAEASARELVRLHRERSAA